MAVASRNKTAAASESRTAARLLSWFASPPFSVLRTSVLALAPLDSWLAHTRSGSGPSRSLFSHLTSLGSGARRAASRRPRYSRGYPGALSSARAASASPGEPKDTKAKPVPCRKCLSNWWLAASWAASAPEEERTACRKACRRWSRGWEEPEAEAKAVPTEPPPPPPAWLTGVPWAGVTAGVTDVTA
eukprot:scaffold7549_cov111-Isochrysis_galbana.AAC.1